MDSKELKLKIEDSKTWYETAEGEKIEYLSLYNIRELLDENFEKECADADLDFTLHRVRHMVTRAVSFLDGHDDRVLFEYSEQCAQVSSMLDAFVYDSLDETADELQVGTKPYLLARLREMMNDASNDTWYCARCVHGYVH